MNNMLTTPKSVRMFSWVALRRVLFKTTVPRFLAGVAIVLPFAAHASGERDWVANPAIVQVDGAIEIFAIGDVHGDSDRMIRLLQSSGIMQEGDIRAPEDVQWTAGTAVVVFLGDLIDKGKQSLKVISIVNALSVSAALQGGRVIELMGNHEAEFLADAKGSKTSDFYAELKNAGLDPKSVAKCEGDVGVFLCGMPLAARVNDWFFSHTGNTSGRDLPSLTKDLQSGIDKSGFGTSQLSDGDSILEARLSGVSASNNWFYSKKGDTAVLSANVAALSVNHLVQGHEPGDVEFDDGLHRNGGEMFQRYGLLFLVDTGMSRAINYSRGAVLHIKTTEESVSAEALCPDGIKTMLWNDADRQNFGRSPRCGQ